jgi:hypothetical protein
VLLLLIWFLTGVDFKASESFNENLLNIFEHLYQTNFIAVIVWWATIFLLMGLAYKYPKIPWVIMVASVGILFGMLHVLFVSANWFLLFPFLKLYI